MLFDKYCKNSKKDTQTDFPAHFPLLIVISLFLSPLFATNDKYSVTKNIVIVTATLSDSELSDHSLSNL